MPNRWQSVYDSALHHPVMAWVLSGWALLWLLTRAPRSTLRTALLVIVAETLLDAYLTGAYTPFVMDGPAFKNAAIAFVVLGDARLWWLVERHRRADATWSGALLRALPWTLAVPLLQVAAMRLAPASFPDSRHVFILYEGAFALLCGALLLSRHYAHATPEGGRYARQLTAIYGMQYMLWVSCDLLILNGQDWAIGLRILPNAIYYGAYVLLMGWLAPKELWR